MTHSGEPKIDFTGRGCYAAGTEMTLCFERVGKDDVEEEGCFCIFKGLGDERGSDEGRRL